MKKAKLKWRLFQNGQILGVFSKEEISEITGMSKNNISTYADTGSTYKGEYIVERVEDSELAREWDRVTKIILRGTSKV